MKHISYPSIDQFRNVVKSLTMRAQYAGKDANGDAIYDHTLPLPNDINFKGTVKLHGTNASFVFSTEGLSYQSRTGIITPLKDNAGFATFYSSKENVARLEKIDAQFRADHKLSYEAVIAYFGEWCGGNIQKGVGLSQLSKRFVLFGIKEYVDDENSIWYPIEGIRDPEMNFFNITDYPTFEITLDLNDPAKITETLSELTDAVEAECPFCKAFGISNSTGEGIVWITEFTGDLLRFKSKGEKHSVVGKKPKDALSAEKVDGIAEFANYTVTENRLNQAIEQVFTTNAEDPDIKKTGVFLKWIVEDIIKEELDTLVESGLTAKDVQGEISKKARTWFMDFLDKSLKIK